MLVFLEIEISQGLFRAPSDSFRRSEFSHEQAAAAQSANHAPEKRVGDSSHRRKNGRGPNLEVAQFVDRGNHNHATNYLSARA